MWRAEFNSEYLEDISRKTGRELTYLQFVQMVHDAVVAQNVSPSRAQGKQLFIDLLGYQDLQLLKAGKKGGGLKMNQQSNFVDPQKAKKRYIILTWFEKFNVNTTESFENSGIKEEIEAENDKTHYPLPLNLVEINRITDIKDQKISKATMRQLIRQMSEVISQSQGTGSIMNTQSDGFGIGGSMLNHTLKSDMQMSTNTITRRTAREFFSRDNLQHPSIEENKHLKD